MPSRGEGQEKAHTHQVPEKRETDKQGKLEQQVIGETESKADRKKRPKERKKNITRINGSNTELLFAPRFYFPPFSNAT
jgi:hypothetical protein